MRKTALFRMLLFACLLAAVNTGCKEENVEPPATSGSISFQFTNTVGAAPVQLGQLTYTNAMGNTWQVDLLKYYISNITLVKSDGTEHNIGNYDLIDEEQPDSKTIQSTGIPNGTYTSLRFHVGIDSARNNSLDQSGDLDPSYGMFWPWNTGYIFFKHEGYYIDSSGSVQPLLFHYGTDLSLVTVLLPVNITVNGNSKTIDLDFDLQALYDTPNAIDFNVDNYHQSTFGAERSWIEAMKQNLAGSFRVTAVH
jgi:hypothetical protein